MCTYLLGSSPGRPEALAFVKLEGDDLLVVTGDEKELSLRGFKQLTSLGKSASKLVHLEKLGLNGVLFGGFIFDKDSPLYRQYYQHQLVRFCF